MATIEDRAAEAEKVVADDRKYLIHSWSVQSALKPLAVAGAEGRYFWDYDGKRYLDFASQLVNVALGHQHPKVIAAIKEQADRLCTIGPPMANDKRSELARLVAEVMPGDLNHTFFTNGGAEANENAIKLARWVTGRQKVIARYRSYHGATAGAISLTGDPRRWFAEPGMPGIVRMLDPYTYRCPAGHPDPCPVCSGGPHLEELLQYEGAHTVAAVIMETIVGTNGLIYPPDGYLQSIREVCDRHGILLIFDEVMAGWGRSGRWFACEHWDVVPDIITTAKGINSGYVPLGAMTVRDHVYEAIKDKYFAGGLTYSGHPLACAAGVASIEAFREEGVVENSAAMGEVLAEELPKLAERHPSIGDVRGRGLFWGLELVRNRETREPLVPFNAGGEAAEPMTRLAQGGDGRRPLPLRPLERHHGRAAARRSPARSSTRASGSSTRPSRSPTSTTPPERQGLAPVRSMTPRVFVTRRVPERVRDELERSFALDVHDEELPPPREELLSRAAGCDGLVTMLTDRVDAELLDAAGPQLRIVANYAVGLDNVDLDECERRGIVVSNTPGGADGCDGRDDDRAHAGADASRRRRATASSAGRRRGSGHRRSCSGRGLSGLTLGIVGYGRIGQAVARLAEAHGMNVVHSHASGRAARSRRHRLAARAARRTRRVT